MDILTPWHHHEHIQTDTHKHTNINKQKRPLHDVIPIQMACDPYHHHDCHLQPLLLSFNILLFIFFPFPNIQSLYWGVCPQKCDHNHRCNMSLLCSVSSVVIFQITISFHEFLLLSMAFHFISNDSWSHIISISVHWWYSIHSKEQ